MFRESLMEWLSIVGKMIIIRECVTKRQGIASLDYYGNSLKQELCLKGSKLISVILFPMSLVSSVASECHEPPVSRANGMNY